jgi:MYXO-CTERM domain-containing protein
MLSSGALFFVSLALLSTVPAAFAAGEPPVAEAGLGLVANVDDTVVLNGSGSYDPEGDGFTYAWTQVGGPEAALDAVDIPKPRFTVGAPGSYRFSLVVTDDLSASAPDYVDVVVPYREIEGVATACAAAPGSASLGLAAMAILAARRRRR